MKRITETTFPSKYTKRGNLRYVAVPSSVIERMGLRDGEYLDVTVKLPNWGDFDIDCLPLPVQENEEEPKRGKKTKTDDE
ncbi:MAG: hypothetical protein IKN41_08230 [Candidatus Methanomethylophilaceae archaeon]|nr:hypothetical protein [Candidatus Methanomethylophilaceae archaeon]